MVREMRANTAIGEACITLNGKDYLFRPSLKAMSRLGEGDEIVKVFAALSEPLQINPFFPEQSYRAWERNVLSTAYDVLCACCDEDITPLIGHMGSRWNSFVPGAMPATDMVHIARCMMKHGVVGTVPAPAATTEGAYSREFNPRDFASDAVAHLGMSTADAWNLTMTEFTGAMKSKFGKPETKIPTLEQVDADMAWLEEINAIRDAGKV